MVYELFRNDGQRIGEGHYTDQKVLVAYHYRDQPDTTFGAKISYRR